MSTDPDRPNLSQCPASGIGVQASIHSRLREAGPLVEVETPAGGPAWVVTDDALARQVLADPRFAKIPRWRRATGTDARPRSSRPQIRSGR